jgi:branched-chain amino acid transport system permease protein
VLKSFKGDKTMRDITIIVVLLVLIPLFTTNYYTFMIGSAIVFAIFALALDLAWGYAGILSLGHSVFFGIGAYSYSILAIRSESVAGMGLGVVLGILVPALLAMAVSWFIFYIKSTPFYIGVVTLALAIIFEQLALTFVDMTGGQNGLTGVPGFVFSGSTLYYFLLGLFVITLFFLYKFTKSDMGKLIVAVRDNEERLQFMGYNTALVRTLVLTVSAAIAGLAGVLYASLDEFTSPSLISFTLATNVVIWVAIGGRGKLVGAVIGALLINILSPIFNSTFPELWQIILGTIFVIVVVFIPNGLYSLLRRPSKLTRDVRDYQIIPKVQNVSNLTIEKKNVLDIRNLKVSFGDLHILKDVNLNLRSSEIQCVIGPNGAGKSTLINAVTGRNRVSSGEVHLYNKRIDKWRPQKIVVNKMARTFQSTNVIKTLTVAENLKLAAGKGRFPSFFRKTNKIELSSLTVELLNQIGLSSKLSETVENLSHGEQQALELCMVVALEPEIMLLDEPTAGLPALDRKKIGELFVRLSHEKGLSLLIIEHDIDFVKEIADRVTVLHDGKIASDGTVDEITNSELVKQIYLGGR